MSEGIPSEMWGSLLRIEGSTARTEGEVKALGFTVSGLTSRVNAFEDSVQALRSDLDTIKGERSQMVPEFKALLERTDNLEDWQTDVKATARTTSTMIKVLWAVIGAVILSMGGWIVHAYVTSLDVASQVHREKTTIEQTTTTPAPPTT